MYRTRTGGVIKLHATPPAKKNVSGPAGRRPPALTHLFVNTHHLRPERLEVDSGEGTDENGEQGEQCQEVSSAISSSLVANFRFLCLWFALKKYHQKQNVTIKETFVYQAPAKSRERYANRATRERLNQTNSTPGKEVCLS